MKNHYHLLLSPLSDGGITAFLRRINIGYANYFNIKHDRSGTLFQGRTKKVPIETEGHFQHILHYIHLNPLDYLDGAQDWRTWQIESAPKALAHLSAYKWSSYNDYCGTKNFPSVLSPDLFRDVYGNYQSVMQKYLADSQKEFEQRATLAPLLIE
jgi:putative transposase